jgi:LysR family transcriptional regulator, glycine cleavage system transcriptional activator
MASQRRNETIDISRPYVSAGVRTLPAMSAIRVFEAAARHLSFTRAARELHMTQAAVSYQIKLLEQQLGVTLFKRLPRQVELTTAAAGLAPIVIEAFKSLRSAFGAVSERSERELSITTLPTFGVSWLAPRLGAFQLAHPELSVRLDCSIGTPDLLQGEFDVAIRNGPGGWPDLEQHFLLATNYTPLCSPRLLTKGKLEKSRPATLLRFPLYGRPSHWQSWLKKMHVPPTGDAVLKGVESSIQHIEVAAAMAGHGVAIGNPEFFRPELATGNLVQPFDLVLRDPNDFWLVYPTARGNSRKICAFRDWVLAELRQGKAR